MGITKAQYGYDLCGSELYLEPLREVERGEIMVSPRINIDYAGACADYLWRYFLKNSPYVSKVARRYRNFTEEYKGRFANLSME